MLSYGNMEIFVHFIKFRMRYYDKSSSVSMSVTKQQKCYKIAKMHVVASKLPKVLR